MFQNNPLLAQLKQQLHKETPRIEGTVKAHEKGYGFLELDNKKSYFIPAPKMKKLLHGDRVEGIIETHGDKEQFEPEKIIESALTRFIARVDFDDKQMVVYPKHPLIKQAIRSKVKNESSNKLQSGDWVVAELIAHPLQKDNKFFLAEITDYITNINDPLAPWLTTLGHYELDIDAPKLTAPLIMSENEKKEREDLTLLPFFSIDNIETKDMDDAIYIQRDKLGQFELTVAIADPTAYIPQDSEFDNIASKRLFTTYLPNFNAPMLPSEIADELCSLKLNEKRAAVICRLTIDRNGDPIGAPYFTTAWIESKAKLDYQTVSDYLEQKNDWQPDEAIAEQLHLLAELSAIRLAWRNKHALLFNDKDDYRFLLDENRQVIDIIKDNRRIANQMIEEAMIVVNQVLAYYLKQQLGYAVFNTHSGFDPKHVEMIVKLLNENGITEFDKEALLSFEGYCALRRKIAGHAFIESRILRYQTPADFVFDPAPHFGLGMPLYTTWTSPLRKYSDMINHRLLKSVIHHNTITKPDERVLKSICERRKLLRYAERDINAYLYCQFLENRLEQTFTAEVIDINKGGAKVRLTDIGAIAFMPVSLIHQDRKEVESQPELGLIKIKQEDVLHIADKISVTLHEVKRDSQSIIVKYLPTAEVTS